MKIFELLCVQLPNHTQRMFKDLYFDNEKIYIFLRSFN